MQRGQPEKPSQQVLGATIGKMETFASTRRSPFDLTGRTALLTGGSGHLGHAIARGLAFAGANVIVTSRNLDTARRVTASLPCHESASHFAIQMNQLDYKSINTAFATAIQHVSPIDILINNAHEATAKDWQTTSADEFDKQLKNMTGYFILARLFRNHIVEHKSHGSVIFLGSMYGIVGSYPEVYEDISSPSPVAYHALKGGVIQMTRHLAVYWARDSVRVNCLSPGPFPNNSVSPELKERLSKKVPLGRLGAPEELIGPVIFLASDASRFMTGQNLIIDGGWTAW